MGISAHIIELEDRSMDASADLGRRKGRVTGEHMLR